MTCTSRAGVRLALVAGALSSVACTGGGLADGWRETPIGGGPKVRWDIEAEPLPEIPLPNDTATWPDPSSPTGMRINASLIAPTRFERSFRSRFDQLDGWGTYSALTVGFEEPIDVQALHERQGGSDYDFPEHAVYLVDLETGVPVPLDIDGGNFPLAIPDTNGYWVNDPRGAESNLLYETVDEDVDGDGQLDRGEDTDWDGVLDRPNTIDGERDPDDPLDTYDDLMTFYERESDTLILRPVLPLRENRTYAVVLTDRLVGEDGQPVRSPFDHVHHVTQKDELADLPSLLADQSHFYGDLAVQGWEGVAFAWTFTTQSVTRDLDALRDGLYARGPFERLAEQYSAAMAPLPMKGGSPREPCDASDRPYVADGDAFRDALSSVVGAAFDLEGEAAEEALAQYEQLGHVSVALFETPYLLGDPDQESLTEAWDIDSTTGEGRLGREVIPALIFVPEESDEHEQPFPVAFYSHGHGSSAAEVLLFAGSMVKQGTAVVALNAQGHGVELDPALLRLLRPTFESHCIGPALDGLVSGRARDLDGDEAVDSGAHFWTAYVFHIRDVVRQTALDYMQAIRIVRSFDGETEAAPVRFAEPPTPLEEAVEFDGDYTGDGEPDVAGDFDGNGVPDIGGPDARYSFMGGSLGGIMTNLMMGVEPALRSGVPVVGAGGLSDVGSRTTNGAVRPAMILRLLGPLVVSTPSEGPSESSACEAGERSVRFIVPWLTDARHIELACMREDALREGDAVIARNVRSGETGCADVTSEGRFRTSVAANTGDSLQIEIYRDASGQLDYGSCTWRGEPQEPVDVIDTWRSGNGEGDARCERCAEYMARTWDVGDRLVAPTEGMGEQRQTPDFRRLMHLAQVALEPADPINYARRVFLEPVTAPDVEPQPRSVLVMNTIGDPNVSISTGNAYARAAGILPFLPPDAPDELAQWRAPASFEGRYDASDCDPTAAPEPLASPNDVLAACHVLEGVARLGRHPGIPADPDLPPAPGFLFDPDDLDEGSQRFTRDGSEFATGDESYAPQSLPTPLRWTRASRPADPGDDAVWNPETGSYEGLSALLNAMVVPEGIHGFRGIDPAKPFDETEYLLNLSARYMATGGRDVHYHTAPDEHLCLAESSCGFFE